MKQHRENWFAIILAVSAILSALPAAAGQGEVLIDQARALAGGITPEDEPGFPITISQPGRYKLTSRLDVPAEKDGFYISTDDVTIDFNGFVLNGHGVALTGITGPTSNRIPYVSRWRIRNGTIMRFKESGLLAGSALVENMRISENYSGIQAGGVRVFRSIISRNRGNGIYCQGGCLIENNIIVGNGGGFGGAGTVLGNTIMNNKSYALYPYYDGPIGYGNNTMAGNNGGGSQVQDRHGYAGQLQPNLCRGWSSDPTECQ